MMEGASHTAKRSMINLCVYEVPPGHVYKGWRGEEAGPHRARPKCGVLLGLPSPSRIPPPTWNRKKGREKEKEGRVRPHSLVQFGPDHGEGCGHLLRPFSPFPYGPLRPNTNSRNSPVLPKIYPNHSEPFRCPNIVVQYIDLYVSTISRLLVMSPISSGTPNSFGTSKHINS